MSADAQGLLVQKYGGSSLSTADRIRAAARRVARTASSGRPVIVVVSAMGDTTDDLIQLAYQVTPRPDNRELDLLLSTGETVSATLMAMALHDLHQVIERTLRLVDHLHDGVANLAQIVR